MKKYFLIIAIIIPLFISAQTKKQHSDKKVNYAFIPVLSYNNSFGMQVGFMANGYFNLNEADTVSPASMVAVMGNIFTNKTLFTGVFNRMYFDEDRWRTKLGVGYGDIRFQTYTDIPYDVPVVTQHPDTGIFVDYRTRMMFAYAEGMRMVINNLYAGIRFVYTNINTVFDSGILPEENLSQFGLGVISEYDTRNNVFNPHSGINVRIQTFSFFEKLGAPGTYHKMMLYANKYFPLTAKSTVLTRVYSVFSLGDNIPFNGKNVVGRDDLRGYSDGKYRADQVYNIQGEYRWNFYKRFGMVAFGGVAIATDDLSGTNYSGLLPAVGAGFRYKAIPKRNINIGIDVAKGIDDWGLYFRIGEAFTR